MTRWSTDWLDEYEGLEGGVRLQLELMRPFNLYDLATDPSNETVIKAAYMPAIGYSSYWLVTKVLGESMPGFWVRAASRYHDMKMMIQAAAPHVARTAYVTAPIALAAGSAYAQTQVWDEIGDPMTGAVHYSGAGTMSGGSMPVIPGDGGHHSTWFDLGDWWESVW